MNRIVLKTLILLLTSLAFASQADAQILKKRPKKLNAKALLAIERQRTDSLDG